MCPKSLWISALIIATQVIVVQ